MDIRMSGSGVVAPGEYEEVIVSGSCKIEGPVRCGRLRCSGSVHGSGKIECAGTAEFSGSTHLDGELEAASVVCSGSFSCADLRASGSAELSGSARLSGGVSGGSVHIGGSTTLEGDIEGESVRIGGAIETPGMINGETVEIFPGRSSVGAVGGGRITVRGTGIGRAEKRRFPFFRKVKENIETLTVRDSIEGDEIELEYTVCPQVTGKRVTIGSGCRIDRVCYSEECTVAPDATVGELIKT